MAENDPVNENPLLKAIAAKLDEIASSWQTVQVGDRQVEIVKANQNADNGTSLLHLSTYSSSISGNPGNAYEFAFQAALYPNVAQMYIASPGNGGTSALNAAERRYYKRTGRLTVDGEHGIEGLPFIKAVKEAIRRTDSAVTRLSGDSAGGRLALALGTELESGAVTHGFFNAMPNMFDIRPSKLALGMLVTENGRNKKRNIAASDDIWQPRLHLPLPNPQTEYDLKGGPNTVQRLAMLATSLVALGRGSEQGDPLLKDLVAYAHQQPDAHNTFVFAQYDPLYVGKPLEDRIGMMLETASEAGARDVHASVLKGMSHAFHTYYPSKYQALKAEALGL